MKLIMFLLQDCVCVVAPHSFRIEPLEEFDPIGDFDVSGGGLEGCLVWETLRRRNDEAWAKRASASP